MAAGAHAVLQAGQLINNMWLKKKFAVTKGRSSTEHRRSAKVAASEHMSPVLEPDAEAAAADRLAELTLIPGLTNDVAMQCLARVPRGLYAGLSSVSRAWKEALTSREILDTRKRLGCAEEWLYVLMRTDAGTDWRCWDPATNRWRHLAPTPKTLDPRESADVLAVDGRVLLIRRQQEPHCSGKAVYLGHFFVQDVCLYDPFTNTWERRTSMLEAREAFAAAVLGSEVIVAGGLTHGIRTRSVEAYNVATDRWTRKPDLVRGRSGCRAVVGDGGALWVFGEQEPQYNHRGVHHSTEVLPPHSATWAVDPDAWPTTSWPGPLAAVDGRLWMLTRSDAAKPARPPGALPQLHFENIYEGYKYVAAYDPAAKRWETVAPLAMAAGQPHCHTLRPAALGGKLILVGAAYAANPKRGGKETRLQVHQYEGGGDGKCPWKVIADGGNVGEGLLIGCAVLSL
ncbi:Galactose oxidase/kelch repeat superfamily protein [Klebsormidium nitens]|uniref:Galactose oxidase/kelch repeat superfamily protein n=1 Tax=Klebsormidium nitens TaxID=105231 RepID=A0A1Y1I7N9_KLENI|nr:Galactose oxidase/kelch repeat superfamily protein [Klebsormidium nitens]|eukprot:GAQ85161.1 Galactose oxidase/kelch repeat superfamily protein [Klebsormidium nitens]